MLLLTSKLINGWKNSLFFEKGVGWSIVVNFFFFFFWGGGFFSKHGVYEYPQPRFIQHSHRKWLHVYNCRLFWGWNDHSQTVHVFPDQDFKMHWLAWSYITLSNFSKIRWARIYKLQKLAYLISNHYYSASYKVSTWQRYVLQTA